MKRSRFIIAGILGFSGVIMAALEAHALAELIEPDQAAGFRWAILLQLFHATALMGLPDEPMGWNLAALAGWGLGVVLFSGSIYGLVLGGQGWLGPVTPVGGLLLLGGWLSVIGLGVQN